MTRWVIVAALGVILAPIGCTGSAPPSISETVAEVQADLRRGNLARATERIEQRIEEAGSDPDSADVWRLRLLRADVLITRSDIDAAMPFIEAALPETSEFAALRGRQQFLQARVHVARGQLEQAAAALDRASQLAPDEADLGFDVEILYSQIRYRMGQWGDAERRLKDVVQQTAAAGDHYREALALNNLGMGFVVRSRFDEALPYFERILALGELDGMTVSGLASNNAGICLARLGQYDRAEAAQRRAIEIHKDGGVQNYLQALGELGNTFLLQQDAERALPLLQQAFDTAVESGLAAEAALWARNLASAHTRFGRWDEAERYIAEARRLEPNARPASELFAEVTAAQVTAGKGQRDAARRQFEAVLQKSGSESSVRLIAYDGLSRLAIEEGRSQEAARHFEAALAEAERTRADLVRADWRLSFLARRISFYQAYVNLLAGQGRVDRALEIADSSRGRVLAEGHGVEAPARVTAASFRRLARDTGSVLLFYWLAPRESRVWVVTGDAVRSESLPPAADIEKLVADHQSVMQNAVADPLAPGPTAGDRLYQALVAPIQSHIPPGASVVVVPDGALGRINFETLTTGEGTERGKHYWIEDVTIQIAPSLALLQRQAARTSPASLLLVGNPTPRAPEFPALSYASAEMSGIAKHFGAANVTSLAGEQATPDAFRAAAPERFSAIHFTSHAVASLESPLDSAVILSGPAQGFKLYARDVAAMPLAADLVTVSACRSAGERAYTGEGLVGFAWAFLRAGSRRVVAGLWDVDDRSTAMLMDEVYARIAKGAAPAAALREAKLALIKQGFPKPYYWAPFQLFTVVL